MSHRRAVRALAAVLAVGGLGAAAGCGASPANTGSDLADPGGSLSIPEGLALRGGQLYAADGCASCHSTSMSAGIGPSFDRLATSVVHLDGGHAVRATRAYLTRSITAPSAQTVAGYRRGLMAAAVEHLHLADHPRDVAALVEFIEMIGPSG